MVTGDRDNFSMADMEQGQLARMEYLESCVKETLRLYPSVPMFGHNIEEDMHIDGDLVPKGTPAIVFTYILHRNDKVWKDPGKFRPERFLVGSRCVHLLEPSNGVIILL